MYAALRERKLGKSWFVKECTPRFARLEELWNKRSQILKDVRDIGDKQLAVWTTGMRDYVPTAQVQSQLEAHNRAEEVIRILGELQKQVMGELMVRDPPSTTKLLLMEELLEPGLGRSCQMYADVTPRAWWC